jgi:hypothetical protein
MKKDFDAVQMMRDIRDKLNSEYKSDPKLREKRLAAIHKKYGMAAKKKRSFPNLLISKHRRKHLSHAAG